MSEPVAKERPIVDLDDFERRLRQRDHHNEDPLAELARLVGETSDPYGDVFGREPAPEADFPAHDFNPRDYGHHDLGARAPSYPAETPPSRALSVPSYDQDHAGSTPRLGGDFAAIEAGLRGALADHGFHDAHGAHEGEAAHDPYASHYAQDDAQHADAYAPLPPPEQRQWADEASRPESGSRRPLYFLVATIAVGVLGLGIAFALKGVGSRPGEVRTIQAASGPTKVQPPADPSADAASHDPGVLGKAGSQPTPTRLVNGEEQPVDVAATMQANAMQPGGSGDAARVPVPPAPGQSGANQANAAPEGSGFGISGMPAPKKVRVVSVRPDGSIVPQEAPAAPANDPIAALSAVQPPALSEGTDVKPEAKTSGATPKTTSRVSTTPKAAATSPGDDAVAPKPAKKPKVKRVAAVEPSTDDAAGAAPADTARGAGDFTVQLAAPGSESEARGVASRLAKKFASALEGRRLGVHKAQSNGKAVYRVRAGAMSKEDAVSLCDKLKADGGSCFVARN